MRTKALTGALLSLACAAAWADPKVSSPFKPLTGQGDVTGSGGFTQPMTTPQPKPPGLADDARAPELSDAAATPLPSVAAPLQNQKQGKTMPKALGLKDTDLSQEEAKRDRSAAAVKRTEAEARDQAGMTAELYKKEVDASKVNNLGDIFYQTKGLWDKADKLYNLAAGWVKD